MQTDTSGSRVLAARVRELRKARGLSQRKLAELSGLSRPTVAMVETEQSGATLATVRALSAALGVTVGELLGETAA